jgi:hypothetical protein
MPAQGISVRKLLLVGFSSLVALAVIVGPAVA